MIHKEDDGTYPAWAWPGGYPVYYLCADNGVMCPKCANDNAELDDVDDPQWHLIGQDINWEDPDLYCDNCNERIQSAYAEPE